MEGALRLGWNPLIGDRLFFFTSRRRHTRFDCDWSSDVCSSDLGIPAFHYMVAVAGGADIRCASYHTFGSQELSDAAVAAIDGRKACLLANHGVIKIGRAACRGRVEISVVAVSLKKKKNQRRKAP